MSVARRKRRFLAAARYEQRCYDLNAYGNKGRSLPDTRLRYATVRRARPHLYFRWRRVWHPWGMGD